MSENNKTDVIATDLHRVSTTHDALPLHERQRRCSLFVWQKCKQLPSCLACVLTFAVKYLLYLLDSEREMTADRG